LKPKRGNKSQRTYNAKLDKSSKVSLKSERQKTILIDSKSPHNEYYKFAAESQTRMVYNKKKAALNMRLLENRLDLLKLQEKKALK